MVKMILEAIAESPGNLKALYMYNNDVYSVDEQIMARMVRQVEELNLGKTDLSKDQLVAIMAAIDEFIGNLKSLNMSVNQYTADDETVDAKVMARAVNKLEKAFFHETVTSEQATKILDEALQSTSLQELTVCGPFYAIDEHLLSQVKQVIPNVYDMGEFMDIYDTDEDSDNEEFDPDQYDGPQFVEVGADGVEIQNLDDL